MHDIDRTQAEYWGGEMDGSEFEFGAEFEGGGYGLFAETEPYETGGIFSEADELALAAELLDVSSEAELDQFLGGLLRKAGQVVGRAVRSPIGRQIGGMLKGVARQALPMVGSAVGNLVVPGVGGALGGQLASAGGQLLGLEAEGMSAEDEEFEVARRIVRLGGEAVRQAAYAGGGSPQSVARSALTAAAQQHAPGLLGLAGMLGETGANGANGAMGGAQGGGMGRGQMRQGAGAGAAGGYGGYGAGRKQSGRWVRRGGQIVLLGV